MKNSIAIIICGLLAAPACLAQSLSVNVAEIVRGNANVNYANSPVRSLIIFKNGGTVWAPKEFSNTHTGTKDSDRGILESKTLKINYDIGFSAGAHMNEARKNECSSYCDTLINGCRVIAGIIKIAGANDLVLTISNTNKQQAHFFPANFWTTIKDEEDAWQLISVALTYKPKK